jgi:hypothetical protein
MSHMKTTTSPGWTRRSRHLLLALGLGAMALPLAADYTVPPTTVGSGQYLPVYNPGAVGTSGTVDIQAGGTATFSAGTSVTLSPGFHAASGAAFRARLELNAAGLASLADTDGDGLPDEWELRFAANLAVLNGAGDFDGDGISNVAEYFALSNPLVNEATTNPLPADVQVAVKLPGGQFKGVKTDWSLTALP